MTSLILDAGALVAIERGDRVMHALLMAARRHGAPLRTNPMVVAQVWRGDGGRQARLAAALEAVEVRTIDSSIGRAAGTLMARAGTSDPIDASLVLLASDGDDILTSDPDDLRRLVVAAGVRAAIIRC